MGNYEQLKAAVSNVIKTNGTQAISGQVLQNTLLTMINSLGSNYQFVGIAATNTNPGTPDQNVFYIAGEGTYTNFANISVNRGELAVLKWNGAWSKQTVKVGLPPNELNISTLYPTNGEGGTNKYTLAGAIAQVPDEYRVIGLKVTFINESNENESWEYLKGNWGIGNFSEVGARTILGIQNKLNVIYPNEINSFNKLDKNQMVLDKSINSTTGQEYVLSGKFASPFYAVKGFEYLYSQIYAAGRIYGYDANFNFIEILTADIALNKYTVPSNVYYIRLSGNTTSMDSNSFFLYLKEYSKFVEYGITEDKLYTDEQIKSVVAQLDDFESLTTIRETSNQFVNKINPVTDFIEGFYIDPRSGDLKPLVNGAYSVLIDLKGTTKFYSSAYAYGSIYGYDENFNFLGNISNSNGTYLVEEDIRYARISLSNKNNKNRIFIYTREEDLSIKTNIYNAKYYDYGITYTDISNRKELDVIPTKLDKFHSMYINSINIFSQELIQEQGAFINTSDGVTITKSGATARLSYSFFIPVVGGQKISSNIPSYGAILMYDKSKSFIGTIPSSAWKSDARTKDYVSNTILNSNAAYIRFNLSIAQYEIACLAIGLDDIHKIYGFGDVFDIRFKRRGKKLVTIGDSITYQRTWQDRLCELTGMWHNPKEIRGADESVKTEGYGYILLTSDLADTDTYYEDVADITKTEETVVDGFGYAHPIWTDASGNKYRQPFRTAEGGETVMPVKETSIYSRASDSKYYKGDVIIVFGGANDKVTYVTNYPTRGGFGAIQGITNLKTDAEDNTGSTFEIYTDNEKLQSIGDYSEVGETTGVQKYNYTFRACFRGLLKKVVDANPNAEIIVVGPYATMIKDNDYINRGYDYLTVEQNKVIAECAREFSCQYIDLFPLFGRYNATKYLKNEYVFIHPTTVGGTKIAEYIAALI